tara:strand:- start:1122 stop:2114 length:993 start_codon:yes stop_codon:yes gene_type:complete
MSKVIFNGNGKEFFGIWIVNTLLSIVTLGIYSPWAKVQNTKYLYNSICIDDHHFDYHAQPIQILKGRLIAILVLVIVSSLSIINESIYFIALLVIFFAAPWLINRSISFNMRMTSYRNVRFNFKGDYWNTFFWVFIAPILSLFTLYLALPHVLRRRDEYMTQNYSYGDTNFICSMSSKTYYKAVLYTLGAILGISLVLGIIAVIFSLIGIEALNAVIIFLGYIFIIAAVASIYSALIRNHYFENTKLNGIASFKSNVGMRDYFQLISTNILMIIFSLGLAVPFVQIRSISFLSLNTSVSIQSSIEGIIDNVSKDSSALLDEVADAFDIEI